MTKLLNEDMKGTSVPGVTKREQIKGVQMADKECSAQTIADNNTLTILI